MECLESWEPRRRELQERIKKGLILPQTLAGGAKSSSPLRFVVYYSPWLLDSARTLPLFGHTLAQLDTHVVRYFEEDVFFSLFYPVLGRQVPRIMTLDDRGSVQRCWGPRPESFTREINTLASGTAVDAWLSQIDDTTYLEALDRSLVTALFD